MTAIVKLTYEYTRFIKAIENILGKILSSITNSSTSDSKYDCILVNIMFVEFCKVTLCVHAMVASSILIDLHLKLSPSYTDGTLRIKELFAIFIHEKIVYLICIRNDHRIV